MAQFLSGAESIAGYSGVGRIFEYVNGDGKLSAWNCGQAAATTLLTHFGAVPPEDAAAALRAIEKRFPPDQGGGWLGSSRRRVTQICKAHGMKLRVVSGETALRRELDAGQPVIVMLGVSAGKFLGFDMPGGHWMVAYGYDERYVYLTNWGEPMAWVEFRIGWRSWVSRMVQMRERGLTSLPLNSRSSARPRTEDANPCK